MGKPKYRTKNGEFFNCPKCHGFGKYKVKIGERKKQIFVKGKMKFKYIPIKEKRYCFVCDGSGKVSWLDNILRKVNAGE